eukprot:CAMPEP_0181128154 /NCGR_PEP_ID=MMETSP1071-20121207/28595_1 /TAXON_ID=35127 /ORGANISM="Thalassiosira sp., Strain NH16" /LENGTH=860 /DNA_ID=CAMNT_0023213971 /DNA_START=103 /DNA_END=2685 /DNA_ORIENTATION=+
MSSISYDDAEGVLQDQGLEVVVIPYRPSPEAKTKARPPLAPKARRQDSPGHDVDEDDDGTNIKRRVSSPSPSLTSPESEDSKTSSSEEGTSQLSPPPPPPPPSPLIKDLTPRSRSILEEAEEEASNAASDNLEVVLLPKNKKSDNSTNSNTGKQPPAEKNKGRKKQSASVGAAGSSTGKKVFASHQGRSNSVTSASHQDRSNSVTSAATTKSSGSNKTYTRSTTTKSKAATPPRYRSRSTPVRKNHKRGPGERTNKPSKDRDPAQKMGFYQMAKLGYQELCNAIIRPPRSNYPLDALGPEEFVFCGEKFVRKDFGVVNERGLLVECSMWKRAYDDDDDDELIGTKGVQNEGGHRKNDPGDETDEDECGQITLNVDDWDENNERGQMYLHVPESFDQASTTSSMNDEEGGEDDGIPDDGTSELINMAESMLATASEDGSVNEDDEDERSPPPRDADPDPPTTNSPYRKGAFLEPNDRYHGHAVRAPKRRVYLHGNSSGRTEVVPQLGHLLSLGVSVVAFDFCGSGRSEGDYVSLGYYEREDLGTVIHHLRASGDVGAIALWGRSMGAATAIMYGSRDPTISCMILDSSFTDLTRLAEEMVEKGKEQGVNVPNFVVSVALRMIKSSVKTQAGFSIRHISPISHVNRCFIPAMFVAGEHDDFINKRHSEKLHAKYAGDKNIVVVDGDHNSPRPRFLLQSACLFLQSCMQLPPTSELVVPLGTNLLAPPWICPGILRGFGLGAAIAKARADAASLGGGRSWLPINTNDDATTGEDRRQVGRQRSQPHPSKKVSMDADLPPGLPLEKGGGSGCRSRSCTEVPSVGDGITSPTVDDFLAAAQAPPDMSERQKEIQSSLFKMLGQHE